jgi:uncharacterized protein (TIGR03067 family)
MSSLTVLALLAAPALAANARPASDQGRALAELRGEWFLVSTADQKRVSPGSKDCKMVITADGRVTLEVAELITNRGALKVSRSGKANRVDLALTTGLFLGVYELKGDELVICCDEVGKARPAGMRPTGTQWVEKWRRAKLEGP